MDARRERSGFWGQTGWWLALWFCLFVAFSPVLLDLFHHVIDNPWARSSLVFPLLAWVATRSRDGSRSPASSIQTSGTMWLWLVLGLGIELFAVAGGAIRFGRIGLLVAIVGLCHSLGWMRIGVGVLMVWALPLPKNLIELFSPFMQTFMGQAAAVFVPGVIAENHGPLPFLRSANAGLPLLSTDNGVALIHGLAGLGWYKALSKGRGLREVAAHSLGWAFVGVPIQIALVTCACVLLQWTGAASLPRSVLTHSPWVIVAGVGLVLIRQTIGSTHSPATIEAAR